MSERRTAIPFSRPSIGEEEIRAVSECLRSGWLTAGPRTAEFEAAFARYVGSPRALAVSSGTAALELALDCLELQPGDEVITPSLTWVSAPNMIVLKGAKPVFVDVDPGTRNVDPARVAEAVTGRTRAVIPVHFAGQPCDMDPLIELCRSRGIALIEDAAHAVGAEYRGRRAGSLGDMAIFSFHPIKNVTTSEGGMLTLRDPGRAERARLLRWHGVDKDPWKRSRGEGGASYDTLLPARKYNFTDLQASLGLVQLSRLDAMIERRARLAALYRELLAGVRGISLPAEVPYPARHAWHLFTVLAEPGVRDALMEGLKARGIGTGLHFRAVHLHSFYQGRFPADLPRTEEVSGRILSLPLYPDMSEEDVGRVVRELRGCLGAH